MAKKKRNLVDLSMGDLLGHGGKITETAGMSSVPDHCLMAHAPRSAARRRQSSRAKILSADTPLRQYTQISAGVVKSLAV